MKSKSNQLGFTMIELLITIAVLGIIATIAFPSYELSMQRARLDNARTTVSDVAQFMERHYANRNTYCAASNNANAACTAPDVSSVTKDANDKYDVAVNSVTDSNYTISAVPDKADDANSPSRLNLFFDSATSSIARCTPAGLDAIKRGGDPGDGCEAF